MAVTELGVFMESLTLVASVLTLVYLFFYALILYTQIRQGTARPDWRISSLFYTGIACFAIANLLRGYDLLVLGSGETGGLTAIAYFVAMAFFSLGFYFRTETARKYAVVALKPGQRPAAKKRR